MAGTVVLSKDQTRNGFANVSKNTANKVDIYNEKDVLNARHSTSDRTIMLWVEFFFSSSSFCFVGSIDSNIIVVMVVCFLYHSIKTDTHTQREREK